MNAAHPPVQLVDVHRTYGRGDGAVRALDGVTVSFPAGSFTAVMGPSGSGKSTLLHCAAGLDEPTAGLVTLVGTPLTGLSETALTQLRRGRVAFVFQSFNLMPALTVRENMALPDLLAGRRPDRGRIDAILDRVGLADRAGHRPGELSGGQRQRVAIGRALAGRAEVLFADEPTGALDSGTARDVLTLLRDLVAGGQTIVMVTHDPVAASYADRVLFLVDGRLVEQVHGPTADDVAARIARLSQAGGRHAAQGVPA